MSYRGDRDRDYDRYDRRDRGRDDGYRDDRRGGGGYDRRDNRERERSPRGGGDRYNNGGGGRFSGGGGRFGGGGKGGGGGRGNFSEGAALRERLPALDPSKAQDVNDVSRPKRPGVGRVGELIQLKTNWFKVEYGGNNVKEIFHYHIAVVRAPPREDQPDRAPRDNGDDKGRDERNGRGKKEVKPLTTEICRAAVQTLADSLQWPRGLWAYDGRSNLYTPHTPQLLVPLESPTWLVASMHRPIHLFYGVVVDNGPVHPFEHDFYLNSHSGIQGTNRPVHYHVLLDQNGFTADGIQVLTYWQCFLFCRCTRSISVCPPAQYAHLAATRGRALLKGEDSDVSSMGSFESGGSGHLRFMPVHPNLNKKMYYA